MFGRLAALFLLVSLTPVLGAAWFSLDIAERTVLADAARREREIGEVAASLVDETLQRAEDKLSTVARLLPGESARSAETADRETLARRLEALVDPPDVFLQLLLFGGGEDVEVVGQAQQAEFLNHPNFNATNRSQLLSNVAGEAVRVPLSEGRPWRAARLETFDGFVSLPISVPVPPLSDRPEGAGALVGYIDFSSLRSTLARLAGDCALSVSDGQGTLLASTAPPGSNGDASLSCEVPVGASAWRVRVEESAERVYAPYAELRRAALRWVLFAFLLAVAASLGLAAWIARPLRHLRGTAEAMQRGELSRRSGVAGESEIGRLGLAFDSMAEALERLDVAKSEFVANVSHELRTPLTSLRLSVENLLDGVVGPLDPRQRAPLERIQRDLDRLARLVDDLLELARLEAGALGAQRSDLDLAELARGCIEAHAGPAARKELALSVEGTGRALADPMMMKRVLANLLDNAVKFAPRGSRVIVRLDRGELRVCDEGPGVTSERVFERFHKEERAGVENPGVGLGLSIVRKLVELQGGRVDVRATRPEGTGATFVVRLEEAGA